MMDTKERAIRERRFRAIGTLLDVFGIDSQGCVYGDMLNLVCRVSENELERITFTPVNGQGYKYEGANFVLVLNDDKWCMLFLRQRVNGELIKLGFQPPDDKFFTKEQLIERYNADEWELVPGELGLQVNR